MVWGVPRTNKAEGSRRSHKTQQQITAMIAWLNNNQGKLSHVAGSQADAEKMQLLLQRAGADLSRVEIKVAGAK